MTEDEAKTKLCHQTIDGEGAYIVKIHNTNYACIGSACMAWRWHPNWGESEKNTAEATELPPIQGYCGLAGRP